LTTQLTVTVAGASVQCSQTHAGTHGKTWYVLIFFTLKKTHNFMFHPQSFNKT